MAKIDWNTIYKKIQGELTPSEEKVFENWESSTPDSNFIIEKAKNCIHKIENRDITIVNEQKAYNDVILKYKKARRVRTIKSLLYYAAASIILFVSTFFVFTYKSNHFTNNDLAQVSKEVIVPGSKKATLILEDGKVIELDSLKSKAFHGEKMNIDIQGKGKTIKYQSSGGDNTKELKKSNKVYNEVRIPAGGEWELTLVDGTVVKLNSKSRLRYPINFTGKTREVFLEGEGYFKVTKSSKPFIVNTAKMDVKVYGTQFNVMAYKDEDVVQTTLVEGKVGISINMPNSKQEEYILKPNEMASFDILNNDVKIKTVDVNNYISWINGMFVFDNIDLATIMRKLSRWYDFEVFYLNNDVKNYRFSGNLVRYSSFDDILTVIKETSYVDFKVKGKTVNVINTK